MLPFPQILIADNVHPNVVDWSNRVQRNGGARPSVKTIKSTNIFYEGLINNNLLSSMKVVSIFAPDSLTACLTPLINSASCGSDPWTNSNFVTGDLTISGLAGNGSNKSLDTGMLTSRFEGSGSTGMTAYNTLASNASDGDMGTWVVSGNNFGAYISFNPGTAIWDCYNPATGGRISAANTSWTGYISFNRTNTASSAIYRANSVTTHAALVSSTTETNVGQLPSPAQSIWMLGQNAQYRSSRRFSFGAVHLGLTSTQSATLFNLVHTLRINLGGGYV